MFHTLQLKRFFDPDRIGAKDLENYMIICSLFLLLLFDRFILEKLSGHFNLSYISLFLS